MTPDTIKPGDECWLDLGNTFGDRQQVRVVKIYKGGNVLVSTGAVKKQCGIQHLTKLTTEELKEAL